MLNAEALGYLLDEVGVLTGERTTMLVLSFSRTKTLEIYHLITS